MKIKELFFGKEKKKEKQYSIRKTIRFILFINGGEMKIKDMEQKLRNIFGDVRITKSILPRDIIMERGKLKLTYQSYVLLYNDMRGYVNGKNVMIKQNIIEETIDKLKDYFRTNNKYLAIKKFGRSIKYSAYIKL